MSRVAVLIPSRGRPESLKGSIQSVLDTASVADVHCWIDSDQQADYEAIQANFAGNPRVTFVFGDRVGPVAAANELVRLSPGYKAYGLITDDTQMVTWGWDAWVLFALESMPLAVISPRHNLGEHVDMPFVSAEWLKIVGWLACPVFYHFCWPILIGLIGEQTAIVHAPEWGFSIHHDGLPHSNTDARTSDEQKFFHYVALMMPKHVEALRNAMQVAS